MWTAVLFKKRKEPGLNSKRLFLECNVSINFNFANGKNFLLSVLHSAEIYKKKQNRGIKKFPFVMGSFNASCQGVARKIKSITPSSVITLNPVCYYTSCVWVLQSSSGQLMNTTEVKCVRQLPNYSDDSCTFLCHFFLKRPLVCGFTYFEIAHI